MLRKVWIVAAPALGSLAAVSAAHALDCQSDTDCPSGQFCPVNAETPVARDCAEGTDCQQQVGEATPSQCTALPEGYCVEQGDCAAGLDCVIDTYTSGCDSKPGDGVDGGVAQPEPAPLPAALIDKQVDCTPETVQAPYGHCQLPVTNCDTDSECLTGLRCIDESASSGSGSSGSASGGSATGGGTDSSSGSTEPALPTGALIDKDASHACGFVPTECTSDAECGAGLECAKIETGGTCSVNACPEGQICDQQEQCTTEYANLCFPKKIPCSSDGECGANAKCIEFTNADGGLTTPEWWGVTGTIKSCLPEGIALLAQSAYGVPGFTSRVGGPDPVPTLSDGAGHDAPKGEGEQASGDNGSSAGGTRSTIPIGGPGSSSCAVGFGAGNASHALWLLAGIAGLVSRRRRRAA